jgi:hypothetical protein
MSSAEGLEILRNWHRTETTVVVASSGIKQGMFLFEIRAKVASVDASTLVLSRAEQCETLGMAGAEFSKTTVGGMPALLIRWPDGKTTLLSEERSA